MILSLLGVEIGWNPVAQESPHKWKERGRKMGRIATKVERVGNSQIDPWATKSYARLATKQAVLCGDI